MKEKTKVKLIFLALFLGWVFVGFILFTFIGNWVWLIWGIMLLIFIIFRGLPFGNKLSQLSNSQRFLIAGEIADLEYLENEAPLEELKEEIAKVEKNIKDLEVILKFSSDYMAKENIEQLQTSQMRHRILKGFLQKRQKEQPS